MRKRKQMQKASQKFSHRVVTAATEVAIDESNEHASALKVGINTSERLLHKIPYFIFRVNLHERHLTLDIYDF
jgi:hypothetical protein